MTRQHPQAAKAPEAKTDDWALIERFLDELGKPAPIMQPPPVLKGACRLETLPAGSLFVIHNPEKPFTLTFTLAAVADVVIDPARPVADPRYGAGIPPGKPFRLTDAQLREWRKRERRCQ